MFYPKQFLAFSNQQPGTSYLQRSLDQSQKDWISSLQVCSFAELRVETKVTLPLVPPAVCSRSSFRDF
jgi:hypothetical protein